MVQIIKLESGIADCVGDSSILRADDYSVFRDAEKLLQAARDEAARIRQEAVSDRERERQRGYEEGQQEARMAMAERMTEVICSTVDYLEKVEGDLADVVQRSIERLLGRREPSELVIDVVRQALNIIHSEQRITLRVAPAQAQTVEKEIINITADHPTAEFISVVPDARLSLTDAVLECEIGIVDASLDTQLAQLAQSFKQVLGRAGGD